MRKSAYGWNLGENEKVHFFGPIKIHLFYLLLACLRYGMEKGKNQLFFTQ